MPGGLKAAPVLYYSPSASESRPARSRSGWKGILRRSSGGVRLSHGKNGWRETTT